MVFEPLLSGLKWFFVVTIPLAVLIVLFDSNTDPAPPYANTHAAHLRGDADSRSASDSQSSSPERRRPPHRPPVPLAPIPPPQATAPGTSPTPSCRRTHVINTHIDQLMARRHVQAVFDDKSDLDFHPGDEVEYWSEEEELSFSSSGQHRRHDRDRYYGSQDRTAPSLNRDFSGHFVTAGERPSAAAPPHDHNYDHDHPSRKTAVSNDNPIVKEVLQQQDQESPAKASARAAARAVAQMAAAANKKAKQKPPLPWRPTPPPMKQGVPRETLNPGIGSDDIADSQFSGRAQKDTSDGPSLLVSQDSSKPNPNRSSSILATSPQDDEPNSSPTGRKASVNTHIDALMRQRGIQHTTWAHVDMAFVRSAGEHQFQDVESYIHAEGGEPGDVDASEDSGAEVGEPYSHQRSREAAQITSMILPYTHRYDAERDLLASLVPSASASAFESAPCRTDSQSQLQKQVHFSRSAASSSTSQPLCAEDPVFGNEFINALSPSVARQIEMRAGGVLVLQDEDALNGEQDWNDDEYRYGDIAGNDHDDGWTEMPSDR